VVLGEGSLSVTAATGAACDVSGTPAQVCSNVNAAVTNGVAPTTYTTDGGALKVFSSDANTHVAGIGMGQYDYNTTFTLALPSTAKAGTLCEHADGHSGHRAVNPEASSPGPGAAIGAGARAIWRAVPLPRRVSVAL